MRSPDLNLRTGLTDIRFQAEGNILAVCTPVQPVKQEQQHCHIKDKKRKKLQTPEKGDTSHKTHQQGRIPNRGETAAYVGNQKNKKHNNGAVN